MKLVRYGPAGKEKPGLIDADGKLRDLSKKVEGHRRRRRWRPASLRSCSKLDTRQLPLVKGKPRLGPCVAHAVASSSRSASTTSITRRKRARRFPSTRSCSTRRQSCIVGANDNVMMPKGSTGIDWEVELAHRHRPQGHATSTEKDALRYVAGYCICNDVSEREFQMKRGGSQWSKGKGCDTFGPLGPWLVTTDEIKDVQNLDMWLDVNGERMQTGNTKTMIFGVAKLVVRRVAVHDAACPATSSPPARRPAWASA